LGRFTREITEGKNLQVILEVINKRLAHEHQGGSGDGAIKKIRKNTESAA
jgi:hypothetical protein